MKLISCENCGVVLDKDRLEFPDIYDDEGCVRIWLADYDGDQYVTFLPCPVCTHKIMEDA